MALLSNATDLFATDSFSDFFVFVLFVTCKNMKKGEKKGEQKRKNRNLFLNFYVYLPQLMWQR